MGQGEGFWLDTPAGFALELSLPAGSADTDVSFRVTDQGGASGAQRAAGPQQGQGVDGIARTRSLQVDPGDGQMGVAGNRPLEHVQPVMVGCDRLGWFVRRRSGRHQQHPIQRQLVMGLLGNAQMPMLRRVKGAAQNP